MNKFSSRARATAIFLFLFSGATGLVYEVLWTRQFELILGATTYSAGVVLAAYMAGLFLGSRWGARWAVRFAHPLKLYGTLELAVGIYAVLLAVGFPLVDHAFLSLETHWLFPHSWFILVRFLGSLALLVIPTTFMGATLPCLSSLADNSAPEASSFAGTLYAVNTAGAVAGAGLAGYWLLPFFGQWETALLTALVNLLLGFTGWILGNLYSNRKRRIPVQKAPSKPGPLEAPVTAALALACLSGTAAMMYEVGYNRILCLILGGSVYAFSAMLASFLAGLSAGALFFSKSKADAPSAIRKLAVLQAASALVVILTGYAFDRLWLVFLGLFQVADHFQLDLDQWQKAIQFAVSFCILFPTAFLSGAVFPLVLKSHGWFSKNPGEKVGVVYAANTLGAIAGSLFSAFLLIPLLGVRQTLAAGVGLNLAAAGLIFFPKRAKVFPRTLWPAMAVVALALPLLLEKALPEWNRHNLAVGPYFQAVSAQVDYIPWYKERLANSQLLYYREGLVTTVSVEKAIDSGVLVLSNNGKVEASTVGDLPTEQLVSHLPLAWRESSLHKAAGRVAVIGLASGITSGSVLQHDLKSLDVVELEPFMPEAAALFKDYNFNVLSDPKFHFFSDDARHFFRVSREKYDIIISEPSNPWISGVSNLFTRECFEIGKKALNEDGIYCQWVQVYAMHTADLKSICRTFCSVFPYVYVFGIPPREGGEPASAGPVFIGEFEGNETGHRLHGKNPARSETESSAGTDRNE